MSFDSREISRQDGQPIRLYEFSRGPLHFTYCTSDIDVTVGGKTFKHENISDNGINFSGQGVTADALTITVPGDTEIAQMYLGYPPTDEVGVIVWDWHYGEADWLVSYVGSVYNIKWPSQNSCEITIWSLTSSLDTPGLRLCWQRGCPYALYDNNCRVNEQDYLVKGTVQAYNGITMRVSQAGDYPSGWFAGGYAEWEVQSGIIERRGIRQHNGLDLVMLGGIYGLTVGTPVNLYPGCARSTTVCSSKFNNLDNFGGAPALPGRSPFDGNPVF
jgi:uncharacterized phage protein (TIGR02218 family)